jgi:hypothetical protein
MQTDADQRGAQPHELPPSFRDSFKVENHFR